MKTIIRNCLQCKQEFLAEPRDVNRGGAIFCSLSCSSRHARLAETPKPNVYCAWCTTNFYKNKSKQKASKSNLHFCSRKCKDTAQRIDGLSEIHPSHFGNAKRVYRLIAFRAKPKICERCGYSNPLAIVVHHKDRNRDNNCIENLEVLCACCHMIEHHNQVEPEGIEPS